MGLLRYRLVNVEGLQALYTTAGLLPLEQIDDAQAEQLADAGSRYVELVEQQDEPPPEAAAKPPRKARQAK